MVSESSVKISKWVLGEIENYINQNRKNKIEYPSKRNFVDKAVLNYLELKGIKFTK